MLYCFIHVILLYTNTDVPSSVDGTWPEAWARRGVWASPTVSWVHLRWLMHEVLSFTNFVKFYRVHAMTLEWSVLSAYIVIGPQEWFRREDF